MKKSTENAPYSQKSHYCGNLSLKDVGKVVVLMGWVKTRRDHGGLIFIDLRDRTGLVQLVVDPTENPETFSVAHTIRDEYVISVQGEVCERPHGTMNPGIPTGKVEVSVVKIEILNPAKTPPFEIADGIKVDESLRLKYRYLDLRRPEMLKHLDLRHLVTKTVRRFLDDNGFLEVETPVLTKSTPEGARDYLVPSRVQRGHFYALPQSPQLFKQILMVAGVERYYQFARCFRDEDLRADRQPEHTQIDLEMSFVGQDEILSLIEDLVVTVFQAAGKELKAPFLKISYPEAMERFGTDRPDIRFDLEIKQISDLVSNSKLKIFAEAVEHGGVVAGIKAPREAASSRKELDTLVDLAKNEGAKGLGWLFVEPFEGPSSPLRKNLAPQEIEDITRRFEAKPGDILLFVADKQDTTYPVLGSLRKELAKKLNLLPESADEALWVVNFPLFEYDEQEKRLKSVNHPFTLPTEDSLPLLEKDSLSATAYAYDLVINGVEVGGGSLRIYQEDLQKRIFKLLGLSQEEAREKFGFLLEAFEYGAPPHGGIALGLDRLAALILGVDSIREVIAFPKTQSAADLLTGAPDKVRRAQLRELGLKF